LEQDYSSRFYVRIKIRDQLGVIRVVGELAEKHGMSIHAILQTPIDDPATMDFAVTTEQYTKLSAVEAFANECAKQPFVLAQPLFFPCL